MTFLGSFIRGVVVALALAALSGAACFDSGDRPNKGPPPPPGPVEVDLAQTYQRIDGFGASSAWTAGNISDDLADQFFSPELGIGLSLLRVQIKPAGNTTELGTARKAAARGAKVWAAPWTPPVAWKTGMDGCGYAGTLQDVYRQDWANRLASFASSMAAEGIPLAAISAQNEPNYAAVADVAEDGTPDCSSGWDSCIYQPTQLVTFIRDFLGPALAAQGLSVPVMAPETQGWDQFGSYADPLMADSTALGMVGPIAMHHYAGSPFDYAPAKKAGKVLWQTEVSDDKQGQKVDMTIDSGLRVAAMIHDNLVKGNVSAWHYWWLMPAGGGNSALTANMTLLPRAYVLGNWSKFVRPGFVRVAATAESQQYVYTSAFHDPPSGRVVLVATNHKSNDLQQDFTIAGGTVTQVTPWLTAEGTDLKEQGAMSVTDGKFTALLPARSVTTFVGTATP